LICDVELVWDGSRSWNCRQARLHCDRELYESGAVVLVGPAREMRIIIGSNLLVGSFRDSDRVLFSDFRWIGKSEGKRLTSLVRSDTFRGTVNHVRSARIAAFYGSNLGVVCVAWFTAFIGVEGIDRPCR